MMFSLPISFCGPVIVTGMHRSGTSLTTSILQKAGLLVGENLLEANSENPTGFFEDIDFLSLHQDILISQGISSEGWHQQPISKIPEQFMGRIASLCQYRQDYNQAWGWKDPRTTLFLDFWQGLLPDAKFVFPYRAPWEVVNSLFTRNDLAFRNNPILAIEIWIAYNRIILDFYQKYPDKCLLLNVAVIKHDENVIIDKISGKFRISLNSLEEQTFRSEFMHSEVNNTHRPMLLKSFFPQAIELYQELEALADLPVNIETKLVTTSTGNYISWVLHDWSSYCQVESKFKKAQTELHSAQAELLKTQQDLGQTQSQLSHASRTIQAMESSKFWRLRTLWISLKRALWSRASAREN